MKKYNWQVIGQQKISQFLQKGIDNSKLTHAYLFSGKQHLGKRLLADNFVSTVLCNDYHEKNKLEVMSLPCDQCVFCNQYKKKIHPDVYYLNKEEDKKNITVEQVRQMQKSLYMASFLNSYKIAMVEDADDMNENAQNALLKILEEPRPKTILILVSNDHNNLLPTIVSRCQLIKFLPISSEEVYNHLLTLGAGRDQAKLLTALSQGQVGKAVNYYQNQDLFKEYLETIEHFLKMFTGNLNSKFQQIDDLIKGYKTNIEITNCFSHELDQWQVILRDILAVQNNLDHLVVNLQFIENFRSLAKNYSYTQIIFLLKKIKTIKIYLNYNINPRLAVENFVLNF